MDDRGLVLTVLPDVLAICRLEPSDAVPTWARASSFWSVSRSAGELSIVCDQEHVPPGVPCERDWRCLRLEGPFPLTMTGVLLRVLAPLADAGVAIFALSTFDTDHVLVKKHALSAAVDALNASGHQVTALS